MTSHAQPDTERKFFALLLLLFVSFRVMSVFLFRPGGFVADFSDYDYYRTWALLTPAGYRAFENMWTVYPPLFPGLMLAMFNLSARIPPWADPRLFFYTFLSLSLLLFEIGNFLLIYRLARKLGTGERGPGTGDRGLGTDVSVHNLLIPSSLLSVILYALLFTPAYTFLGWFEPMPLFFMLLGLDLLLESRRRRWGWAASALAAGLGILAKLTPALLIPLAVRWLGAKLSLSAARSEWFNRHSPGNLLRPTLYTLLTAAAVVGFGYPLVGGNPALAFSSLRANSIRPPWQSLWAVLDGYYGFGQVPLDMRNLAGLDGPLWQSHLPWSAITLAFGLLFLWLYTRAYDWQQPRTLIAFAGVSVIWLFLYSKGWSPQFVVWVMAFLVLLLPDFRGIAISVGLMFSNFVESHIFIIMLPNEHWLLWGTVLFRTGLLLLVAAEFLGQIWPGGGSQPIRRWSSRLSWGVLTVGVLAGLAATPALARAYVDSRLAAHPCREAVAYLQAEAEWPEKVIATDQSDVWEQFYPWLRQSYDLRLIDGYRPDIAPERVIAEKLTALGEETGGFWWLTRDDRPTQAADYFQRPDVQRLDAQALGTCHLARVVQLPPSPIAVAQTEGGPIRLLAVHTGTAKPGEDLNFVVYWQAEEAVAQSYTVFTQLLNEAGQLIAQQDNLPVMGLAPTDTWQPGIVVRDPYRLTIPAQTPPGNYRLIVGLYTDAGRVPVRLADGSQNEFVELSLSIAKP
ncbi:MAG: hypothetical protein KF753_00815 [Caldilineaceae bacterium]|nr:hypothetical protein [Caldilineaceae bacterium]